MLVECMICGQLLLDAAFSLEFLSSRILAKNARSTAGALIVAVPLRIWPMEAPP